MRLEFSLAAETDLDQVFADGVAKFGMPAADDYLGSGPINFKSAECTKCYLSNANLI